MIRKLLVVSAVMVVAACRSSTEALLVRVDAEAAGENCVEGGVAIRTGYDSNNSGALDDNEVDASKNKFVCNGTNGSAGQPGDAGTSGHNSLNQVTNEPAGTNCANGGSKIETGLDVNDDGTLEAGEVTSTSYVCVQSTADDFFFGDLVIRSDDDIALLAGKRVVFGNIDIQHATAGVLTLASLEAVTGDINVGEGGGEGPAIGLRALTPVREIHLPKLFTARALYFDGYDDLTVVDMPLFERTGGVYVDFMGGLTTVSFPALKTADAVGVNYNDALTTLNLPALTTLERLRVTYNPLLATVTLSNTLTVRNSVRVTDNELLNDCFAHRLASGTTHQWDNDVADNLPNAMCTAADACSRVTIPALANFYQCSYALNFADANTMCGTIATGSTLAWFESTAEWNAFSSAVSDGELIGEAWIGYSDEVTEGTWVALGGMSTYLPMSEPNFWASGESNDSSNSENAAHIYDYGRANDGFATDELRFFCRVP